MRAWKCKQVVDFDNSTTTVKEERNRTLLHQTKLSISFSFGYIGAQSDLTQVMTLKEKNLKLSLCAKPDVNCEQWQAVLWNSVCN